MRKINDKQKGVLNSLLGNGETVHIPDDDSVPLSSARREASKSRHVSKAQLAGFLDRDPNTIDKWIKDGMPFVDRADRDIGKPWVFDTADVVRWMERRAAEATAEKLGGSADGLMSEGEAKRRRAVVAANMAEIELAELQQSIVRISVVIDRVSTDFNEMRSRLMGVADAAAGRVDPAHSAAVKKEVAQQVDAALKALRYDRQLKQGDVHGDTQGDEDEAE